MTPYRFVKFVKTYFHKFRALNGNEEEITGLHKDSKVTTKKFMTTETRKKLN